MKDYKPRTEKTGTPVQVTKKINRFFSLAKNVASNSSYGKIRHGALLIKGGSIINACCNKDSYSSFGKANPYRHWRKQLTSHNTNGNVSKIISIA